ncbi:ABC transporter permease [Egibacter rhizosphaerae]|uniref:ABC transporter permease n=1 Tax=Egibacter rhizosphaerae TaxID=1670831 RepID=A0A411YF90_9ACTN|nr:ABC transporter permease [Egibacter rhizosphaerae]QBI19849.1 ABC transporter permease [Egibacter rhizosphaerae]
MSSPTEQSPRGPTTDSGLAAPGAVATESIDRGVPVRVVGGLGWIALRVYPIVLLLVVWQLLVTAELLSPFVLPGPVSVAERAWELVGDGSLQGELVTTLGRIFAAYGLALVVGTTLGLLMGRLTTVRLALRPLVAYLFPTPKIAIYPALLIIFGLGTASKVALGFAESVFPILLATAAASSQIDPRLLWSARALGTSERRTFPRVVLPASLPGILTGARIGLVGAIIGVYLGEMIAGGDGLGNMMDVGWRLLRTADMYVSIAVIAVLGLLLDRAFLTARRRLLAWSDEGAQ